MPNRRSFTAIACASPGDAARLAAIMLAGGASTWGTGPPPDLIEANGGEVDLTWFSQSVPASVPVAAIAASGKTTGAVSYTHNSDNGKSSGRN